MKLKNLSVCFLVFLITNLCTCIGATNSTTPIVNSTKIHPPIIYNNTCSNGGKYSNVSDSNSICQCPLGYTGDSCNILKCENGGEKIYSTNSCKCVNSWTGNKCLMCERDIACPGRSKCKKNRPIISLSGIRSQCEVIDEDIGKTFGNVMEIMSEEWSEEKLLKKTSSATAATVSATTTTLFTYGWKRTETINEPTFFCKMSNCTVHSEKRESQGYLVDLVECENTECNCMSSTICNKYIKSIINSINGKTTFKCINHDGKRGNCNAKFSSLSWTTPLKCETSKCVEKITPTIPPPLKIDLFLKWARKTSNKWKYYWIIYGIIALLATVLTISLILIDCFHHVKRQYEMKRFDYSTPTTITAEKLGYYLASAAVGSSILKHLPYIPVRFRKYILNDLSFKINEEKADSHLHIFIGNSGEGKTTILKCITNAAKQGTTTGKIRINGMSLTKSNLKRVMSVAFDTETFNQESTVSEILDFTLTLKGIRRSIRKNSIIQTLKQLELLHLKDRKIGQKGSISSGEYKRVIVANAIVSKPKILILDEPTSGLDDITASQLIKMLKVFSRENKSLVLIVAHSIGGMCYQMFDGVTILADSRVIKSGTRESVDKYIKGEITTENYVDPYVHIQQYIGELNRISKENKSNATKDEVDISLLSEYQSDIELKETGQNNNHYNSKGENTDNNTSSIIDELEDVDELGDVDELEKSLTSIDTTTTTTTTTATTTANNKKKQLKNQLSLNKTSSNGGEGIEVIDNNSNTYTSKRERISLANTRIVDLNDSGEGGNEVSKDPPFSSPYSISFLMQFVHLTWRDLRILFRSRDILWFQFFLCVASAGVLSLFGNSLANDIPGCQTRIEIIAFMSILISLLSSGSIWRIKNEFSQMIKETDSKLYNPWVYLTSKLVSDFILLRTVPTIIFSCITYYSMGVMADHWWIYVYKYIILCFIFTLISLISSTICLAISFLVDEVQIFTSLINVILLLACLGNGAIINVETVLPYLKLVYNASFVKYATEALYINEFLGSTVIINPKGFKALNISIPVDGKFYLTQLSLDSTAMEFDIFALSMFFLGHVFILYPLFSLAIYLKKKK